MSRLDIARRFAQAMLHRSNTQVISMPMLCAGEERLFFYYTKPTPEGTALAEISAIWSRTVDNGELTEQESEAFFQKTELAELYASHAVCAAAGPDALSLTKRYYDAHETLYQAQKSGCTPDRDALKEYVRLLWEIVPEGSLREAYRHIGSPLFRQLEAEL